MPSDSTIRVAIFFGFSIVVTAIHSILKQKQDIEANKLCKKEYMGTCHCGAVKFKVTAPKHLTVWDCNCSICLMKKNWHFIVPSSDFELTDGSEKITEYRFNTKVARHKFCSVCGVQAFYHPRSNPDGIAVTLACVSPEQLVTHEVVKFDGNNWEKFFSISNITKFSAK